MTQPERSEPVSLTGYTLPDAPECPCCGCEAEVEHYLREVDTKIRVGFKCTCGAIVQYGHLAGMM